MEYTILNSKKNKKSESSIVLSDFKINRFYGNKSRFKEFFFALGSEYKNYPSPLDNVFSVMDVISYLIYKSDQIIDQKKLADIVSGFNAAARIFFGRTVKDKMYFVNENANDLVVQGGFDNFVTSDVIRELHVSLKNVQDLIEKLFEDERYGSFIKKEYNSSDMFGNPLRVDNKYFRDSAGKFFKVAEEHLIEVKNDVKKYKESFEHEQSERNERFARLMGEMKSTQISNQKTLTASENAYSIAVEKFTKEFSRHGELFSEQVSRAEGIVGAISKTAITHEYAAEAEICRIRAEKLMYWATGLMVVAALLVVAYFSYAIVQGLWNNPDWAGVLVKWSSILVLLAPAFYLARESTIYRKQYMVNKRLALEHAALKPYINDLDDAVKRKILEGLAERYFGRDLYSTNLKNEKSEVPHEAIVNKLDSIVMEKLPEMVKALFDKVAK